MKKSMLILISGLVLLLSACKTNSNEMSHPEWESLWNGSDLSGWHTYFGVPHPTVDVEMDKDDEGNYTQALGIDNDPLNIVTIQNEDDAPAIRISGEVFGMIYTERSFENYHLKLQFKWGEKRYTPRANQKRDSGLLYHGFGEPGSAYTWMGSQELQIQETDLGDYWPVGPVEIDIPSKPLDSLYFIYDKDSPLRTYHFAEILNTAVDDSLAKRRCFKNPDNERPNGEWNDVELICMGDSSIHIVNGQVVMRLYNSKSVENGVREKLTKGKICIQSEGAEVFYRNFQIKPIDEIPEAYQ